jgi:arginine N-succinyltransferase
MTSPATPSAARPNVPTKVTANDDDHGTGCTLVAQHPGGPVLASARLLPGIGLTQPRYWYHVGLMVHAAAALSLLRPQRTLLLGNDLTGAAELCEIHWTDASALPALIEAAQNAMRADTARYGQHLIVELPGVRDGHASAPLSPLSPLSPFWQGLGRHFYPGELTNSSAWRSQLATLLPRHLVYASFLPDAANAAIGGCATQALPLRDALVAAGLQWRQHIGIVDGAAVMEWQLPG